MGYKLILMKAQLETPFGSMIAIGDETELYLLEFEDRKGLQREIDCLQQTTQSEIISSHNKLIDLIEEELRQYFYGNLREFTTPVRFFGTSFQRNVWEELRKISLGETCSYSEIARAIGKPSSCRPVAQAIRSNQLSIIIPCHRVIYTGGGLGGYSGGIKRKKLLLEHEKDW
jgi:AraC family transcriptional regulator, regulatory protein of adaptative response / methylated-DNA-[protein]-cysteine methyltransferase